MERFFDKENPHPSGTSAATAAAASSSGAEHKDPAPGVGKDGKYQGVWREPGQGKVRLSYPHSFFVCVCVCESVFSILAGVTDFFLTGRI